MVNIGNSWDERLKDEFESEYYQKIRQFLKREYGAYTVYPDMHDIFNALRYTDYDQVKAVILGQDPYHGPGQAHGLAFSVRKGVPVPPSLQNIYQELFDDLGIAPPFHGNLESWAKNGVLLLNTALTVRARQAASHRGAGWEIFTDHIIGRLNEREEPMVFLLWGSHAKAKAPLVTSANHLVLTAAHPSPLSAFNGFFGCRHFSKTNAFLGKNAVDWRIPE